MNIFPFSFCRSTFSSLFEDLLVERGKCELCVTIVAPPVEDFLATVDTDRLLEIPHDIRLHVSYINIHKDIVKMYIICISLPSHICEES